jgi:signal transduction histidine kinase
MNQMEHGKIKRTLLGVQRFVTFFLLIGFVVTCCMLLFLNTMIRTMGIGVSEAEIKQAAVITFWNVLLLTLICSVIDVIRRRIMVDRPVRRIAQAAERVMKGDFSVRIPPCHSLDRQNGFDTVIEYFNQMTEALSGIEALQTDIIANVSHELKTPLAIIQNYGTMLQQPGLTEGKRVEYAKAITGTSRRLAELISNILKLNKLENQSIFPQKDTYDLGEQLCECLLGFENLWEQKKLAIETDMEEAVLVKGDPEMMGLVWNNLFSNAIKFTEPGGTVGLRMKKEGSYAVVQVSDTGCGISEEVGRHMFDKFYQGDPSHSAQGNGLGLALVKRVIDITGAELSVESTEGKGSTFTVRFRTSENE